MTEFVNASPAKRFFVEMLTRDIRLEDAVLDLVDNAVDSLIRSQNINLTQLLTSLTDTEPYEQELRKKKSILVEINDKEFRIEDNCGGIEIDHAREHVFRFGAAEKPKDAYLSVYGIGLKRAVLKMGRYITVESRNVKSGFRVTMDIEKFERPEESWHFPIEEISPADSVDDSGTIITVKQLTRESQIRLRSGLFENQLVESIGQSYSLFLNRFVNVKFNDRPVTPATISISNSDEVVTSLSKVEFGEVQVFVVAGLQTVDGKDWRGHTAGWYVICNGRVVVFADRTALTGWGVRLPIFQPKHRGFIGIAMFISHDPELLPWTTTKRGVNAESEVYQFVRERMMTDARPVIRFLDKRYQSVPVSSENTDNLEVRDGSLREALVPTPINTIFGQESRKFSAASRIIRKERMLSVQYRIERAKIVEAKEIIGDGKMSAGKVGLHTFEYFLSNEAKE